MALVSLLTWGVAPGGAPLSFVVSPPVGDPWYELLLANYAHLNRAHLYSNALVIAVAGGIVSPSTSPIRFHAFFLGTGIVSSIAQVSASNLVGHPTAVLGSSGAAFALVGYVLVANPVSLPVVRRLGTRWVAALLVVVGVAVTVRHSPPGSALLSHFVGVFSGMLAGRFRLLRVERR
jgi:membrane associated rhomboid family serine protease